MASKSVFIVTIDFCMSYSGWCFSLAPGTDRICQLYWGTEEGIKTPKTPMCILFNQKFRKFGCDEVQEPALQEGDNRYFFRKFKMKL